MSASCRSCGFLGVKKTAKGPLTFCTKPKKAKMVDLDFVCKSYRNRKSDKATLAFAFSSLKPVSDETVGWLSKFSPSDAFLTAIGAGPWKLNRRAKIQAGARDKLAGRDLTVLTLKDLKQIYPFYWQWESVLLAIKQAKKEGLLFDDYVRKMAKLPKREARREFFKLIDGNLTKVTSLFMRDYLLIECFPIDRWVERWLIAYKLPVNEQYITRIGMMLPGIKVREYARAIFLENSVNPD